MEANTFAWKVEMPDGTLLAYQLKDSKDIVICDDDVAAGTEAALNRLMSTIYDALQKPTELTYQEQVIVLGQCAYIYRVLLTNGDEPFKKSTILDAKGQQFDKR